MKKNAFLLLVVIISIILSGCLFSSKYDPESDFTTYNIGRWVRRDGNIVQIVESIGIAGYAGTKTDVRIPPRINRLPVTTIGQGAFRGKELTSVTIPNSVTRIQGAAFRNNQLTSIIIPNSVTEIRGNAFEYNQLINVVIPDSVIRIGSSAFENNQLTSVNIGNSVTTIGTRAFSDNQLTSVEIPDSVTSIEGGAFRNNQLTSVSIGNSVTTIGERAFENNQLTSVVIPNNITRIARDVFTDNPLTSITIGAHVALPTASIHFAFTKEFDYFYKSNGSRAGTYTLTDAGWSLEASDGFFTQTNREINVYFDRSSEKHKELLRVLGSNFGRDRSVSSQNTAMLHRMGMEYLKNNEYERAIDSFIIALRIHSLGITYYQLGLTLMSSGDFEHAEKSFRRALARRIPVSRGRFYHIQSLFTFDSNDTIKESYLTYYNIARIKSLQNDINGSFEYLSKALFHGHPYIEQIRNNPDFNNLFSYNDGYYLELIEEIFAAGFNNTLAGRGFALAWGGAPREFHFIDENRFIGLVGSVWPDPGGWQSGEYDIRNHIIFFSNLNFYYDEDEWFRDDFTMRIEELYSGFMEIPLVRYVRHF